MANTSCLSLPSCRNCLVSACILSKDACAKSVLLKSLLGLSTHHPNEMASASHPLDQCT